MSAYNNAASSTSVVHKDNENNPDHDLLKKESSRNELFQKKHLFSTPELGVLDTLICILSIKEKTSNHFLMRGSRIPLAIVIMPIPTTRIYLSVITRSHLDGLRNGISPSPGVRPKWRIELPLEIHGSTYAACPDSGTHENIMVHGMALQLGLEVEDSAEYQKEFRMGNGKVVKSLGYATVMCSFAKEPGSEYLCHFYIFQSLIKSVIIGMAFLDATETLTKHKHRLQSTMIPRNRPLQFCVLDNPAQRLSQVNTIVWLKTPEK